MFCSRILKHEGVSYDPKTLISIVQKCYPDIRKTVQVLQENTLNGKLTGSRIYTSEDVFRSILVAIKDKDPEKVRELLKSNYIFIHNFMNTYMIMRVNLVRRPVQSYQ